MVVYMDNAATSWPRPPEVVEAVSRFLVETGVNPGRSAHRLSIAAGRILLETREALAELFGLADPLRIVFCLNGTEAINLVLRGLLRPGDRVVTSSIEHNAMMRPLSALARAGVEVDRLPCAPDGSLVEGALEAALERPARLVALNHASNVMGTLLPVAKAGELAHAAGALLLVDAAASAGTVPIHLERDRIDLLAFTGHKALLGPPGTGGLCLGPRVDPAALEPLKRGGTGSRSEHEEQPDFMPDRFEAGTPPGPGLAGLGAGVRWVLARGVERLAARRRALVQLLLDGLAGLPGCTGYGPKDAAARTAAVSFNLACMSPAEVARRLDEEHAVLGRPGLHCAPSAHRTQGTFPGGAMRLSPGPLTTPGLVEAAVAAVASLAREGR